MTSCALSTFILVLQAERTRCTQGKQLPSLSQSFLKKVSHQFQDVARWSLSVISDLLLIHACLQSSHEMPSYKKRVQQAKTLFVSVQTASINGALVCYLAPTSRYVCLLDTHKVHKCKTIAVDWHLSMAPKTSTQQWQNGKFWNQYFMYRKSFTFKRSNVLNCPAVSGSVTKSFLIWIPVKAGSVTSTIQQTNSNTCNTSVKLRYDSQSFLYAKYVLVNNYWSNCQSPSLSVKSSEEGSQGSVRGGNRP